MKIQTNKIARAISVAITALTLTTLVHASDKPKIEDPYEKNPEQSPWTLSMEQVKVGSGQVIDGASALINGPAIKRYAPDFADTTNIVGGGGSTKVSIGCDGINLGGVIDGQLSQYGSMIEGFIQAAPAMAIMFLAYSQPTVKAVIDELNTVGQFGLDMTNMSCSGVRAIADKAAEDKAQSMAEARCTAEAGFKDPECMSDDGLEDSLVQVMKDAKSKMTQRTDHYLGKATGMTGGLIKFNSGSNSANNPLGNSKTPDPARVHSCNDIESDGLRTLVLSASGMACDDIKNYAGLLPNYEIGEEGQSGVTPRTMTLKMLANEVVTQHTQWLDKIVSTPEADYPNSDAFKAVYNRSGYALKKMQHRRLARLKDLQPAIYLNSLRELSTIVALRDLSSIVSRMKVAIVNGMQNQADNELISSQRSDQMMKSVEALEIEYSSLLDELLYEENARQSQDMAG